MKRMLALLLALMILGGAVPGIFDPVRADDEKKDEKKKDDKKDDKKKDEKATPADEKLTDAQKDDLKKLTGTFTVKTFERDGKKKDAAELKKMKVIQKGSEWNFHDGDEITQGKDTVFPDKNPKEIDSLYTNGPARDKVVKGLYKIDGDSVTYIWAEPGKDRPKEFATKTDSGLTLLVLERAKEEKPAEKDKDKAKDKDKDKAKEAKDKDKAKDAKDKDK